MDPELLFDDDERTAPISFPPNGYGLYDMTGNVWEWTADQLGHIGAARAEGSCCGGGMKPRTGPTGHYLVMGETIPRMVIKDGSHLCAPNYCVRFRPAARQGEAVDTSASHIGFRCIRRPDDSSHSVQGRGLRT